MVDLKWEEANPTWEPWEPLTPEMVIRTLRAMLDTSTIPMVGIAAVIWFKEDGADLTTLHFQASQQPLGEIVGGLEAFKYDLLFRNQWENRILPWMQNQHRELHERHFQDHLRAFPSIGGDTPPLTGRE